jgi:hypothetical protein
MYRWRQGLEMGLSEFKAEYAAVFHPKEYLADYSQLDEEVLFTIRFMVQALRGLPSDLLTLEFGGGPVLYSVATQVPYAREIHFCDFLPANLAEVRCWLNNEPDAFDWTPYFKQVLEEEGMPANSTTIGLRAAAIRCKVNRLSMCDALVEAPLGREVARYDLVVANYCTDVAAATAPEWMRIMRNIGVLVESGGWLLVSVTTGATANTFVTSPDQRSFPCVDLSDEELYRGFITAGCDPQTFRFDRMSVPTGREYSGLTTAIARKSGRP